MAYLQLERQHFPLGVGETLVGPGADAQLRVGGSEIERVIAVFESSPEGAAAVRRATPSSVVHVNGMELGGEPHPLIHGDKIELGGRELFFGDDRQAGNTMLVQSVRPEASARGGAGGPKPPAATGGRLVSLVDGREYPVPPEGLVIGRDPTCDIVVPATEVSRKHAAVALGIHGYMVVDTSTNGIQVNGETVATSRTLGRGDVLKVANEEFRFYAEAAPAAPEAPEAPAPVSAPAAPVLAMMEVVNEGVLKGRRFELRAPLAQVGRGAHNDIVIPDSSVSESHAKFQRRSTGWHVVDMGSTNGTYVAGRRVLQEQLLTGAPDVRLGNVKFIFRPADAEASGGGGTMVIAPAARVRTPPFSPLAGAKPAEDSSAQAPAPAAGAPEAAREPKSRPRPAPHAAPNPSESGAPIVWIALALLLAVVAAFYFMSR